MENSREQNLFFGNKQRATLSVQTIQRAAAILRCFSEDNSELSLTLISQLVSLHKNIVSRLLLALQSEGYVAQNRENGKWRLGLGLLGLAGLVLERMNIRELAQGSLSTLAEQTMETIGISVRDGAECINIKHIPSPRPIQYAGRLGRKAPLHCTSVGRVCLAFLPATEWDAAPVSAALDTATMTKLNSLVDVGPDNELDTGDEMDPKVVAQNFLVEQGIISGQ